MFKDTNLIELQRKLEKAYASNQLMPTVRKYFSEYPKFDIPKYLKENEIPVNFGINLLANIAIKKRAKASVMMGILIRYCQDEDTGDYHDVGELLERCLKANLVNYDDITETFIVNVELPKEIRDQLDLYQYPLPLVVEPRHISDNKDSGYYTFNKSILLNNPDPTNLDLRLDHINRMNSIPLSINMNTANHTKLKWKKLATRKEGETKEEYRDKLFNFEKFKEVTHWVMESLTQSTDKIYLTSSVDYRGRTYYNGYHCNPQGVEWNRACIELYEKEVIPLD